MMVKREWGRGGQQNWVLCPDERLSYKLGAAMPLGVGFRSYGSV